MLGHLLIFYTVFTLIAGSAAIVTTAIFLRQKRDRFHRRYLVFLLVFTTSVFLYLLISYYRLNIAPGHDMFLLIWGGVDIVTDAGVIITGILFFHTLYSVTASKWRDILAVGASVIAILLVLGSLLVQIPSAGVFLRINFWLISGMSIYYLLFLYLLFINISHLRRVMTFRDRFFAYGLFAFSLIGFFESLLTIPFLQLDSFIEIISTRTFYIATLPYVLWAVTSTIVMWRTASVPVHNYDEAIERLAVSAGLTVREIEVVKLLFIGHSNQKIADSLFISLQTVKTHVHHIFQKTGSTGRFELISKIQSKV
jgi:DNA-binding CsgD family transcriptional regulator